MKVDIKANKIVNELLDMFFISNKNSYLHLNIVLARFYKTMLNTLPDNLYEHIHEAFMVEV